MPFNSSFVSSKTNDDTKSQISVRREAREVNWRVNLTLQKPELPWTSTVTKASGPG